MYFSKAKVGDRVWDYVYGEGDIMDNHNKQIIVYYENIGLIQFYDFSGKHRESDPNQRLFYYDDRPIQIKREDLELDDNATAFGINSDGMEQFVKCDNVLKGVLIKDYSLSKYTRKVRREEIPYINRFYDNTVVSHGTIPQCKNCKSNKVNVLKPERGKYNGFIICGDCGAVTYYNEETPEFIKDIVKEEKSELEKWWDNICEEDNKANSAILAGAIYEGYEESLKEQDKNILEAYLKQIRCINEYEKAQPIPLFDNKTGQFVGYLPTPKLGATFLALDKKLEETDKDILESELNFFWKNYLNSPINTGFLYKKFI